MTGGAGPTVTTAPVLRRRLPVDLAGHGQPGMALVLDEHNHMGWVRLTPWFGHEPWRSAVLGRDLEPETGPVGRPSGVDLEVGRSEPGSDLGLGR